MLSSYDGIVQQVPMLGPGAHPSCLAFVRLLEEGVGDREVVSRAQRQETESICVHLSNAVLPKYSSPDLRVRPNSIVEVSQKYNSILLGDGTDCPVKFPIEISSQGGGIHVDAV